MQIESSEYVKTARKTLGLTQQKLAEKLEIERYNLAKYETGKAMPSGDLILKIQELLFPEKEKEQ